MHSYSEHSMSTWTYTQNFVENYSIFEWKEVKSNKEMQVSIIEVGGKFHRSKKYDTEL